jgi:hypothetical protein
VFVHEVTDDRKGNLENKLVKAVPDAGNGSMKFTKKGTRSRTVPEGKRR